MRCDQCNKFVSFDDSNEPEINDESIEDDGNVLIEARIVLTCAECGQEMKSADFTFETSVDDDTVAAHKGEGHELEVRAESPEMTTRIEGKGRGAKTFYGVDLSCEVYCACQAEPIYTEDLNDDVQASYMEELV